MNWITHLKLKDVFHLIIWFLVFPLTITLLILFAFTLHLNAAHQKEKAGIAAADITASIDASVSGIMGDAMFSTYSNDFNYFCNSRTDDTVSRHARKSIAFCQAQLFLYAEVTGLILYSVPCDSFYPVFKPFEALPVNSRITEIASAMAESGEKISTSIQEVGGRALLFHTIMERYGSLTVVVDLTKNQKLLSYAAVYSDTVTFSITPSGPAEQRGLYQRIQSTGLCLTYSITYSIMSPVQIILLAVIAVFFILIPFSLSALSHMIVRPLNLMSDSMKIITAGNFEHRIPPIRTVEDISGYLKAINIMLDTIQKYKEEEFSSRMEAVQAKLQYLQLQIRPHFYLNCMKNLNSLINLKKYSQAQTLIYALSNYISYAFMDFRTLVPIRSELESIQSYVDLCSTLSKKIHLELQMDGECVGMGCIPMSLLTFVENSIKHSRTGETLRLFIHIRLCRLSNGEQRLKYTLQDSGGGFPENVLREYKSLNPVKSMYRTSQIGIVNVHCRLHLVYGDRASLTLRNEGGGAVVEIVTPCSTENQEQ